MIFKKNVAHGGAPLFQTSKRFGSLVITVYAGLSVDSEKIIEMAYQEIRESNDPRKVAKKLCDAMSKEGIDSTEVFVGGNDVWTIKLGRNMNESYA